MNKKYSFIFAFLITGLILCNVLLLTLPKIQLTSVIVARVIDGDTLELEDGRTIRLSNINAPESNSPFYNLSKNFLKEQLENKSVNLETLGNDRYSRTLARIYSPTYINLELVKLGLSKKAWVQDSETEEFAQAEAYAIENSRGMWKLSPNFNCIQSEILQEEEIVILRNKCSSIINLQDYTLTDESRKEYKFNSIYLYRLNIHSKEGKDNKTDIFWNSKTNIWNNDKDTLYLFDKNNLLANYHTYGY